MSVTSCAGGALWRVVFGASRGNVLDAALVNELHALFAQAAATPSLKAVVLEGSGAHFSYGASVQEHLPEQVADMLRRFHGLLLAMLDGGVAVIAAVRGQCLGGGLELASVCQRIMAAPDARLGQPEIALGVFPPFAALLLRERVGRARAEELCLTGRSLDARDALALGLVDEINDDPAAAALDWASRHLLPHSAASLRHATRALRLDLRARLVHEWPAMRRLYLDDLMATHDAVEGLRAFLEKRPPRWTDA